MKEIKRKVDFTNETQYKIFKIKMIEKYIWTFLLLLFVSLLMFLSYMSN